MHPHTLRPRNQWQWGNYSSTVHSSWGRIHSSTWCRFERKNNTHKGTNTPYTYSPPYPHRSSGDTGRCSQTDTVDSPVHKRCNCHCDGHTRGKGRCRPCIGNPSSNGRVGTHPHNYHSTSSSHACIPYTTTPPRNSRTAAGISYTQTIRNSSQQGTTRCNGHQAMI